MYPVQVHSWEDAKQKQEGPFDRKELMEKLLRLTGDTTLNQTGPF
ncbi:hypothetical protein Hsw_2592 [Hymenobacter swuensis DY53]|uniref:Uncharacterized protein n=1 Tax=Hymenobacter swuensis DY53 TaxID=1227739 RepID=W8F2D3_9BACT|nr:hypothetical protein Hsw_2592 [Hymenobacter swuensis DY53]